MCTEATPCSVQGLAVKAIRGDAVLFYSLLPNGTVDPLSEHGSCATLKGQKYSATKWVRGGMTSTGGRLVRQSELSASYSASGPCAHEMASARGREG